VVGGGATTPAEISRVLWKEISHRDVEVVENFRIISLQKSGGKVVGVLGLNSASLEFHVFLAKSVVLATGGA